MKIISSITCILLFGAVIFTSNSSAQLAQSNLHIELYDTAMVRFMDTVEAKLLAHIANIQKKKNSL